MEGTPQALEYYYADVTSSATGTCTLNNVPAGTYNLYLYGINGGTGGTRSNRGISLYGIKRCDAGHQPEHRQYIERVHFVYPG